MFAIVLSASAKAEEERALLNYQMGAFDALEWAWHMLRSLDDEPTGVDEARRIILETISKMGKGTHVNFDDMISEVKKAIKP